MMNKGEVKMEVKVEYDSEACEWKSNDFCMIPNVACGKLVCCSICEERCTDKCAKLLKR